MPLSTRTNSKTGCQHSPLHLDFSIEFIWTKNPTLRGVKVSWTWATAGSSALLDVECPWQCWFKIILGGKDSRDFVKARRVCVLSLL